MKMCIASLFAAGIVMNGLAESIQLPAPALAGGLTVMQALQARHSERSFSDAELSPQELSGLLWAANGFNRPDKRTNATGMNKQTIEDFGDCVYGDGAQVGAYARMYLANELARAGDKAGADKLRDEIRTQYPNARSHNGKLLSELLPASK